MGSFNIKHMMAIKERVSHGAYTPGGSNEVQTRQNDRFLPYSACRTTLQGKSVDTHFSNRLKRRKIDGCPDFFS